MLTSSIDLKQSVSDFYFLEPTSKRPDGIWIRKNSRGKFPDEWEIISRSSYDMSKVTSHPIENYNKFIPDSLLNGYNENLKKMKLKPRINDDIKLELIGQNKLKDEIDYWSHKKGDIYLVENHYLTNDGEGEPFLKEEIINEHYC